MPTGGRLHPQSHRTDRSHDHCSATLVADSSTQRIAQPADRATHLANQLNRSRRPRLSRHDNQTRCAIIIPQEALGPEFAHFSSLVPLRANVSYYKRGRYVAAPTRIREAGNHVSFHTVLGGFLSPAIDHLISSPWSVIARGERDPRRGRLPERSTRPDGSWRTLTLRLIPPDEPSRFALLTAGVATSRDSEVPITFAFLRTSSIHGTGPAQTIFAPASLSDRVRSPTTSHGSSTQIQPGTRSTG